MALALSRETHGRTVREYAVRSEAWGRRGSGIGSVTAIAAGVGFYALAPAIPEASVGRGAVLFAIGAAAALTAIGATLTAKR